MTAISNGYHPDTDFTRTPPHDRAAEQGVLGAMMLDRIALADVGEIIGPADHYLPPHQLIHEAICELDAAGEPTDAIAVGALLLKRGDIGKIGGADYLHTLIAGVASPAFAGSYARVVREHSIRRALIERSTRIIQAAYTGSGDADEIADLAQAEIFAVAERRAGEDFLPLAEVMPGALDEIEAISHRVRGEVSGVPTGFADLDILTDGLHPGQMVVVAGRPALGKSTLGLDFARSAAIKHRLPAAIFSLEMSRNEITMRLLSAETRLPLQAMRTGQLTEQDWTRLAARMAEVANAPLFIDDSPNMSMMQIRTKCRRLRQRHDLRLVVVDYLQLMSSPRRTENRQQEVSEISRQIKLLAKEIGVPVVAISQLNRGPEQRTDKRPMLSDLRESGSLEQDSDVVILLHREDAYDRESPRAGEADFIVAKHRNGPTTTVTVAFQGHYSRFVDMAPAPGGAHP